MKGADGLRNIKTQTFPSSDLSLHDHKMATSFLNIFTLVRKEAGPGYVFLLEKKRIYPKILANFHLPSSD